MKPERKNYVVVHKAKVYGLWPSSNLALAWAQSMWPGNPFAWLVLPLELHTEAANGKAVA